MAFRQLFGSQSVVDYSVPLTPAPASQSLDLFSNAMTARQRPDMSAINAHAESIAHEVDNLRVPAPREEASAMPDARMAGLYAMMDECVRRISDSQSVIAAATAKLAENEAAYLKAAMKVDAMARPMAERNNQIKAARDSLFTALYLFGQVRGVLNGTIADVPHLDDAIATALQDLAAQSAHAERPPKPVPQNVNARSLAKALTTSVSALPSPALDRQGEPRVDSPIVMAAPAAESPYPVHVAADAPVRSAFAPFVPGKRVPLPPAPSTLAARRPTPPVRPPIVPRAVPVIVDVDDSSSSSDNNDDDDQSSDSDSSVAFSPVVVRPTARAPNKRPAEEVAPAARKRSASRMTPAHYCEGVARAPPAVSPVDQLFNAKHVTLRSEMVRMQWTLHKSFVLFLVDANCDTGASAYSLKEADHWTEGYIRDEVGPVMADSSRIILNMSADVPIMEYWPRMRQLLAAVPADAWNNIELCIEADRLRINEVDFHPLNPVPYLRVINTSPLPQDALRWGCLAHMVDLSALQSFTLSGQIPWAAPNVAGGGGTDVYSLSMCDLQDLESVTLCHDLTPVHGQVPGSWTTYCGINQCVTGGKALRHGTRKPLCVCLPDSLDSAFLTAVARKLMATLAGTRIIYRPGSDAMGLAIARTFDDLMAPQYGGAKAGLQTRVNRLMEYFRFLELRKPMASEDKKPINEFNRPQDVFLRLRSRYGQ